MTFSEKPLLSLEDGRMNHEAIFHQFNRLSSEDKTEYLSLSYLPLKFQLDKNRANTLACEMKADPLKVLQICYSNGFRNGVFPKYSKFNHSCVPNAEYVWNEETSSRELRAMKLCSVTLEHFVKIEMKEGKSCTNSIIFTACVRPVMYPMKKSKNKQKYVTSSKIWKKGIV